MKHDWIKSTLGHGETMCRRCGMTNREAAVLGYLDECDGSTQPETEVIPNQRPEQVNRKPRSADKTQPGAATGESQTAPGDAMPDDTVAFVKRLRDGTLHTPHDHWHIRKEAADMIEKLARESNGYRDDAVRDRSRLREAEAKLRGTEAELVKADAVIYEASNYGNILTTRHNYQYFIDVACERHAARTARTKRG